jgi:hypothetical protein
MIMTEHEELELWREHWNVSNNPPDDYNPLTTVDDVNRWVAKLHMIETKLGIKKDL